MSVLDIIQTVVLVVALVLTIIQMKHYLNGLRITIDLTLREHLEKINETLMESPEAYSKLSEPYPGKDKTAPNDKRVFATYRILNYASMMFSYHKQGYISDSEWRAFVRSLKKFTNDMTYLHGFWKDVSLEYEEDFQTFMNEMILS